TPGSWNRSPRPDRGNCIDRAAWPPVSDPREPSRGSQTTRSRGASPFGLKSLPWLAIEGSQSKLVQTIQRRDLVGFRERRVVEHGVPEILDRPAQCQYRLADVDHLGCTLAQSVHAEHRAGIAVEKDLEKPALIADDLPPRNFLVLGGAHLVGDS